MDRKEILEAAAKCVCGDREQDYGSPEQNFSRIAEMWNAYLGIADIYPWDVAAMLALLKIARIGSGHAKQDNWVDLAGYAACGGELESKEAAHEQAQPEIVHVDADGIHEYSPCTVFIYEDGSWGWEFAGGTYDNVIEGKPIGHWIEDCTVQIVTLPDGKQSSGWWRNSKPPINLSDIWVTDDED